MFRNHKNCEFPHAA